MNNLRETLIIVGITVALFVGIIWIATPSEKTSAETKTEQLISSSLVAPETKYDFGTISMAAGKVKHLFVFKNTGNEAVTITTAYTSCMCTAVTLIVDGARKGPFGMPGHGFLPKLNELIPAGAEVRAEVVFDPAAHGPAGVGPIARSVILETSSGRAEMIFSAVVTP
jgi:hypothetical protein